MKVRTRIAASACSVALVGALSACSSSDSGGSDAGAVDCDAANNAVTDYTDALTKIVQGLTENDTDTARSGADALPDAALTVLRSLPGLPTEAEAFLTISEDAGRVVNDSLSAGVSSEETPDALSEMLSGSPDFTVAGDAVDDYFREQCPSLTPGQPQQDCRSPQGEAAHMATDITPEADDIFDFCNRLAWQLGGPILIHAAEWGVVAYSNLPQHMDEWRRMTILRRQIPIDQDIFDGDRTREEMITHPDHIFTMPAVPGEQAQRTFVPVMVMGALVGSIWLAESAGEIHPDTEEILLASAKQATVYFRARTDEKRREADIFLNMLPYGGHDEDFLGHCLTTAPGHWLRVIAVWHGGNTAIKDRLAHMCVEHAASSGLRAFCLPGTDRVYALLQGMGSADEMDATSSRLASRILSSIPAAYVALGSTVRVGGVPESRREADKVLDYLCHHPDQHLADIDGVRTGVALMELADTLGRELEAAGSSLSALSRLDPAAARRPSSPSMPTSPPWATRVKPLGFYMFTRTPCATGSPGLPMFSKSILMTARPGSYWSWNFRGRSTAAESRHGATPREYAGGIHEGPHARLATGGVAARAPQQS